MLSDGVRDAGSRLEQADQGKGFMARLAAVLHQEPSEQTSRMAAAIVVNAFVFHFAIEGQSGIPDVASARGTRGFLKSKAAECWTKS